MGAPVASSTVAVNVRESPIAETLAAFGAIAIEPTTCLTVTVDVAVEPSALAVIVAVPLPVATTLPLELTVATAGLLDANETVMPSIDAPVRATILEVSDADCPIDAKLNEPGVSST